MNHHVNANNEEKKDDEGNNNDNKVNKDESSLPWMGGFDLLGSTERQATFLWQIMGERFDDVEFLKEGVTNYHRFLQLKPYAAQSRIILVPTYQIDFMWHTHILSGITNYNKDCRRISGSTLHHDDSLTDRSDGGILDTSYVATSNLWKERYGINYAIPGGMYRGEPPKEYFNKNFNDTNYDMIEG